MDDNVFRIWDGAPLREMAQHQIDAIDMLRRCIDQVERGELADILIVKRSTSQSPLGKAWSTVWVISSQCTVHIIGALEFLKTDVMSRFTTESESDNA